MAYLLQKSVRDPLILSRLLKVMDNLRLDRYTRHLPLRSHRPLYLNNNTNTNININNLLLFPL